MLVSISEEGTALFADGKLWIFQQEFNWSIFLYSWNQVSNAAYFCYCSVNYQTFLSIHLAHGCHSKPLAWSRVGNLLVLHSAVKLVRKFCNKNWLFIKYSKLKITVISFVWAKLQVSLFQTVRVRPDLAKDEISWKTENDQHI